MSENSSPYDRGYGVGQKLRKLRALVAYPLWLYVIFIGAAGLLGGVALTKTAHIPGLLEILQWLGVPLSQMNESVLLTVVTALMWLLVLAGVIGLPRLMPMKRTTTKQEIGLSRMPKWSDIGLGLVAFIPYIVGAIAILYMATELVPGFDVNQEQETGFGNVSDQLGRAMAFLALVIIAPFVEELLFRGYLYGKLRRYGAIVAALVVSALFAYLHSQWNVGLDVFVLSLVACGLREITGSIWAGVVLHMTKNTIAYYALFIAPLLVY